MQDHLFESPGNPPPDGIRAGFLTMRDGVRIRYAWNPAAGRPLKGTVILIQGRNESIEKYFETARDLSDRGFGTATFDLRGQGGSDRMLRDPERGHVDDFRRYVDDIEPFFQDIVLPDCRGPYFVLAHSTGALVALMASPLLANRVQRMVLTAPLLGFAGLPFSMRDAYRISSVMQALGLGSRYLGGGPRKPEPTPFAINVLTSDPDRYRRNNELLRLHPGLGLGGPTAAWVRAACLAIDHVGQPEFTARLHIPTMLVAAGNDKVVDSQATERFAQRLRAGSLVTIDGARHEIMQEADIYREQFFAAFDAFVPGAGAAA